MNIGEKIRKVRELKGFKQEYVAGKLGLSVTAYGNIERNESSLSFDRLEEIARVLEVSVQDILNIPEQFNVHSIVNSQQIGFNHFDNYTDNRTQPDLQVEAFKIAIENLQTEVAYLRQQNLKLIDLLENKMAQ